MSTKFTVHESPLTQQKKVDNSRRTFLKLSGATLATTALFFSGCDDLDELIPEPPKTGMINLGSGDIGILNYAYALEQLEAEFYTRVVLGGFYPGASEEEKRVLDDIRQHEIAHREFFQAALGNKAIPKLVFNFSMIDFTTREGILQAAETFENLGVAAYNGAGPLLRNPDFLLAAGKIVSVEARHAEAILDLINPGGAFIDFIDEGLDRAIPPSVVLEAIAPLFITKIDGSNLPTA